MVGFLRRLQLLIFYLNGFSVALPAAMSRLYQTGFPPKPMSEETQEKKILEDQNLRYDVSLDSEDRLHLYWDIDLVTEEITLRLEAKMDPYKEWLGFGFSNYGEATDADLVIFWTDAEGKRHFQDSYTDSKGRLFTDQSQDYTLVSAWLSREHVSLTFHRTFDTCDDNDYIIDSGTTHLVFFISKGKRYAQKQPSVTSFNPGLQRVQLIRSQLPDPVFPEDTFNFVIHVKNVEIPNKETTYWCQVTKIPELEGKHHIIQFEGAISPQSQGIVHHLEVFHCLVPEGVAVRDYNGPCKTMGAERPAGLESCRKVIGAWAMGARPLAYPEEAGVPIGGPGFSPYVMLEVHYNNPNLLKGIKDNSGARFYVTPSLRQYDAGVMELGQEYTDKFALPPNQPEWILKGYCVSECTSVALPERGIEIFASQLHTHLTGKRVYTKHFRNNVELPEVNRDNHYSPHYQEIRKLPRHVTVLQNDMLVTTCIDSTKGKNLTLTGFSISDEMCVNYIHYYPATELEVCKSSITTKSLNGFFKFLHDYVEEDTSSDKGINENYHSIHWTPMNVHLAKTFYDSAPLSMQCNQSNGNRFPGEWEDIKVPKVLHTYPPKERPCLV